MYKPYSDKIMSGMIQLFTSSWVKEKLAWNTEKPNPKKFGDEYEYEKGV